MKKAILFLLILTLLVGVSCTKNRRAFTWGGKLTIDLPANQKLVIATWKDANLWYLTRPMRAGEVPETYTFKEKSEWGVREGTVTFVEH